MKRKLFTFLMAFLAIAGNAVWAQTDIDLSVTSSKSISDNGVYHFKGTTTIEEQAIVITDGSPTIYLHGVIISVT